MSKIIQLRNNKIYSFSITFLSKLLGILICTSSLIFGGTTGKISGKVIDKETNEPIIGANVVILGTYFGAATDIEGYYYINNVTPGKYNVVISAIGFHKMTYENVVVKIDLTTNLDVELTSEAITLGEVVVQATAPLVTKDLTSTSAIVSSEDIKMMPVEDFHQVVNLQAGVVAGHFRGGRVNEVAYLVDGIPVNDVYNNSMAVNIENNSIRQLEVISGTFNAEYGQALSGVVNIITEDGSEKFEGNISAYIGSYFTQRTDVFWNMNKVDLNGPKDIQFSLSGPTMILDALTFFISGRYFNTSGNMYGQRYYNITDLAPIIPDPSGHPEVFINRNTGDSSFVAMNSEDRKSFSGKLTYNLRNWKLSYSLFWDNNKNKYYNHGYRLAPDGLKAHFGTSTINNLIFSYYPSMDMFLTFKYSSNLNKYWGYLYEDEFDPRYIDPNLSSPITEYTFRYGGNETDRYKRYTWSNLFLFSADAQVSKEHKVKFGAEARFHKLFDSWRNLVNLTEGQLDSVGNPIVTFGYTNLATADNHEYVKYPYEYALFVQDKMEYDMMIINLGLRLDYFNSNTSLPVDMRNPLDNPLFPGANQTRQAESQFQISPRLGISFPISDEGALHFSYGHFFQIPSFENLYANNDYIIDQTTGVGSIVGNPELKAQKTVKYEIGLQQVIFPNISADISIYYNDIRNLLGTEILETYEGFRFARYINRDYGNSKGLILSLEKRHSDYFSARLDYTFQLAQGNASDPLQQFYNNQTDPPVEETKKLLLLDWDQTSTLNFTLTVGDLSDWSVGAIFSYGTGLPYTIDPVYNSTIRIPNNGRKPTTINFDLKATKVFQIFGAYFNTYLLVYNLFDINNEYGVSSTTGRAGIDLNAEKYTGYIYGLNTMDQYLKVPTDYSGPREIRVGFGVGF